MPCLGSTATELIQRQLISGGHYVGRGMYERSSDFIKYALDFVFFYLFFKFLIHVVGKSRFLLPHSRDLLFLLTDEGTMLC